MDAFKIQGGVRLRGEVQVSGSKTPVPIMAALLLSSGNSVIQGVPDLADVRVFTKCSNTRSTC